jgi:hypothetical protein
MFPPPVGPGAAPGVSTMSRRKKTNWDAVGWTAFEEIEPPVEALRNNRAWAEQGLARWFANSIYLVRAIAIRADAPFNVAVCLTVQTHDHQARHDWRELQRIKNEIVGTKVEAVEVYPSEDRLVDNSNLYHLFCFPELGTADGLLPFGFAERLVSEGPVPGHKQRDFRPELRPDEVVRTGLAGQPRRTS